MPIIQPVMGPYQAWYAPYASEYSGTFASLGALDNTGIKQREPIGGHELTTGLYGETVVDGVTAGSQGMFLDFVLQEVDKVIIRKMLKPNYLDTLAVTAGDGTYAVEGAIQPSGVLWSQQAGMLKLKPLAGTYAATMNSGTNNVRWYKSVFLNNGNQIEEALNWREKFIQIQLRVLPYTDSGGVMRFWEYTSSTGLS
jgi:hypothetical protein